MADIPEDPTIDALIGHRGDGENPQPSERDLVKQVLDKLTPEQRQAVLTRDWLGLLQLGGNIYYTFKLAIFDRRSMQYVGGAMSGVTEQEFTDMMITGGRAVEGNLYTSEEK